MSVNDELAKACDDLERSIQTLDDMFFVVSGKDVSKYPLSGYSDEHPTNNLADAVLDRAYAVSHHLAALDTLLTGGAIVNRKIPERFKEPIEGEQSEAFSFPHAISDHFENTDGDNREAAIRKEVEKLNDQLNEITRKKQRVDESVKWDDKSPGLPRVDYRSEESTEL